MSQLQWPQVDSVQLGIFRRKLRDPVHQTLGLGPVVKWLFHLGHFLRHRYIYILSCLQLCDKGPQQVNTRRSLCFSPHGNNAGKIRNGYYICPTWCLRFFTYHAFLLLLGKTYYNTEAFCQLTSTIMPIPSSSISYFVSLNYTKFSVVEDIPENAQLSALTITRLSNYHSLE